jgi:hypothetical protein
MNTNASVSFAMTASPLMGPGMASPALPYMSDWFQSSNTPTLSGMSPYLSASAAAKIAQQQQMLPPAMKLASGDAGPQQVGGASKKRKVGEQ